MYTTLEGFTSKNCTVKSYNSLNESMVEWVNGRTMVLAEHRSPSELKAGEELRRYFNDIEYQVFFRIHWRCYFLDYYLPKYRVAIEIDGGYHKDRKEIDKQRDKDFRDIGIRTIRIKSQDVMDGKFIDILKSKMNPRPNHKKTTKKDKKANTKKRIDEERRNRYIKSAMKRLKEHEKNKNLASWM